MAERIKQVAITYITHRLFFVGAVVGVLIFAAPNLIALSQAHSPSNSAIQLLAALGMPLLFLLPFLVRHAKTQFGHSRSRLTPDFATPHLATLAAVLAFAFWIYPLFVAWCGHIDPVAMIAIAAMIGVPIIWGTYLHWTSLFFVSIIFFFSLYTERAQQWWFTDAEMHRLVHVAIAIAGAALLVAWLRRLSELNEELPEFGTSMQWGISRPGGGESIEHRRSTAAQVSSSPLITQINDFWLTGLPAAGSCTTVAQIIRLLRFGFAAWPAAISALFMTAMLTAATLFMAEVTFAKQPASVATLNFFLFFAVIMPGFQAGEAVAQRRPRIALDLLRPVARPQLIEALFRAAAQNGITYWLITNCGLALMAWHLLGDQITLQTVATYITLSAATAFLTFGLCLRTAVWRSQLLRLSFTLVMWSLISPLAAWWLKRDSYGDFPFVVLAAILAGIGALFVENARKAWLNLELG